MRRQFGTLEKQGREDYFNLMTILQDFADDPLSLDVNQIQKNINDDDLYPEYK